jgi:hypothetical protein
MTPQLASAASVLCLLSSVIGSPAAAHWSGHPADPALHAWFDSLASGKGLCCSFADGVKIEVDEWDTLGSTANGGSGYRVRLDGRWIDVPRTALVTTPNKAGAAYVWPYQDGRGKTQIRCFIPGAGT